MGLEEASRNYQDLSVHTGPSLVTKSSLGGPIQQRSCIWPWDRGSEHLRSWIICTEPISYLRFAKALLGFLQEVLRSTSSLPSVGDWPELDGKKPFRRDSSTRSGLGPSVFWSGSPRQNYNRKSNQIMFHRHGVCKGICMEGHLPVSFQLGLDASWCCLVK